MPADADGRVGAIICVIDVDETAPVLGKFLMADDAAESPDGGLVDGAQWGSGGGLRVGGDEVEPGLDGVLLCERLDEPKNGEGSELLVLRPRRRSDMSSGQQFTMPARSPSLRTSVISRLIWSGSSTGPCPTAWTRWPRLRSSSAMAAPTPAASARTSQDWLTRPWSRSSDVAHHWISRRPLSIRSGDMREEAASDCTVKPSITASVSRAGR